MLTDVEDVLLKSVDTRNLVNYWCRSLAAGDRLDLYDSQK